MEDSFIAVLKAMVTIQRWNLQPKVETWVEAENAISLAHLAYCIAKANGIEDKKITHLIFRILLKPLQKHYTTDISHLVTDKLKEKHEETWKPVVNKHAKKIAKLLPREISEYIMKYLAYEDDFASITNNDENKIDEYGLPYINEKDRGSFTDIITFCQNRIAIQECQANAQVYPEYYKEKLGKMIDHDKNDFKEYHETADRNEEYLRTITRLKYIRRWNTTNRFVSSSVLGHTYIVSVLSIVLSLAEGKKEKSIREEFIREALLRAMFHDVPESMTGDIITPVKEKLNEKRENLITNILDSYKFSPPNSALRAGIFF